GGCLPLLLQMPVFFALYYLLNSEFSLRGAVFIPGWITDLSQPESILHLPFTIPLIGWTDIRLLPIIYVGTQLISSRLMQNPDVATSSNMKMITYLMPVMFFFILYNAPSGLILYWTVMNILTVAQQMYMNRHRRAKAAAAAAATSVGKATSFGSASRKPPNNGKRRK
ncbi:MAG TPA: membrane protein insertase YidC, partial [Spirochaetia bacterium]|nr:membrane protein insertase YidC [Spirochaetia bacterium]